MFHLQINDVIERQNNKSRNTYLVTWSIRMVVEGSSIVAYCSIEYYPIYSSEMIRETLIHSFHSNDERCPERYYNLDIIRKYHIKYNI